MTMQRYIYKLQDKRISFCYFDTKEYDLQKKIDLEIKMREGTSKLLAACEHPNQTLEAAKSLLTSDIRLSEFRSELQKRKATKAKKTSISKAKASISEIRVPLIWKDTDYFKNKGDYRRFAVFCLVQIGTEIYDTIMVNVDRNVTDICFEDAFLFNDVKPDFQLKISIYARVMHDDLSMASTQKKLKHKISNSLSRSLGRKFSSIKEDLDPESGPKFYLMASAMLNLKDCSDSIKTYDLNIENVERNLQLPLFGHFCARLAVQPECQTREYKSVLIEFVDMKPKNSLHLCSVKGFKIHFWEVERDLQNEYPYLNHTASSKPASFIVPINKQTRISQTESQITITNNENNYCFQCLKGSQSDLYKCLQAVRDDFIAWETIAEYQMQLASVVSHHRSQHSFYDRNPGALYNETPIQEHILRKRHSKSLSNVKHPADSQFQFSFRTSNLIN